MLNWPGWHFHIDTLPAGGHPSWYWPIMMWIKLMCI